MDEQGNIQYTRGSRSVDRMVKGLSHDPKRGCYVYALCAGDGVPFYIGQGQADRIFQHEWELDDAVAKAGPEKKLSEKLKAIRSAGDKLQRVIIKWGLTKSEALMCESALINLLEWKPFSAGRVPELTNIADGHASEPEKCSVAADKTVARTVDEFVVACGAEERDVRGLSAYNIAFIKINKLYPGCQEAQTIEERNERIKDCVRGCWNIGRWARGRVEYLVALYRQQVVGIYHVQRCIPCDYDHLQQEEYQEIFPTYPTEVRGIDLNEGRFKSFREAKKSLQGAELKALEKRLNEYSRYGKRKKSKDEAYATFQKGRVFFEVDEEIPTDIRSYNGCILIKSGDERFLVKGRSQYNPVWLNFKRWGDDV